MEGTVRFQLLGPMRINADGREVAITSVRDRMLLAALLLSLGEPVPAPRLVDTIWGEHPPADTRNQLHGCVSRLRRQLVSAGGSREMVVTTPAGYRLAVSPGDVDLYEFRRLRNEARRLVADRDRAAAIRHYRAALVLWRGPALAEIESDLLRHSATALDEERVRALEECIDLELAEGRADDLIPELTALVQEHPYREKLHGALMLALYRAGRQGDALAAYRDIQKLLLDDLGTEPGDSLQHLHRKILNRDASLNASPPAPSRQPTGLMDFRPAVPRTLPPDIPDFVGREKELTTALDVLTRGEGRGAPVVVVTGPAGIGKTALSVRLGYELRHAYQDGQMYVNLHGFDADTPVEPFEVLGRFLRALGVDGATIPATLDERAELYRNLLADRAVLVVLDNAANDDQVLPLIPGDESCGVIVTSRLRLGSIFGADTINLDVLEATAAADMVSSIAGTERTAAEPAAVTELARLCACLPLAVRIAAGRLATKPHWSVERLVQQLRDERQRLDQLAYGGMDVRVSIAMSYRTLSDDARRLLRRLGDIDLPEITSWISAAILDTSVATADDAIEQLFDAQLIEVARPSGSGVRYRFHDLVRLFAKERAEGDESFTDLEPARRRAFAVLHSVIETVHQRAFGGLAVSSPLLGWNIERSVVDVLSVDPAKWCDDERPLIVAATRRAAEDRDVGHCWAIVCAASMLFQLRGYYDDLLLLLDEARTVTQMAGDDLGLAAILFRSGMVRMDLQDHKQAQQNLEQAIQLFVHVGNDHGEALASLSLATIYRRHGQHEVARQTYQSACRKLHEAGDLGGEALALRCVGQVHLDLNNLHEADTYFVDALALARASGSRRSEAQVLFWRGMLRMRQRLYLEAQSLFAEVRGVSREIGDRYGEAQALRGLGLCHQHQGDIAGARAAMYEALRMVRQPRPTVIENQIKQDLAHFDHSAEQS